jgi:hypothetical protein
MVRSIIPHIYGAIYEKRVAGKYYVGIIITTGVHYLLELNK